MRKIWRLLITKEDKEPYGTKLMIMMMMMMMMMTSILFCLKSKTTGLLERRIIREESR